MPKITRDLLWKGLIEDLFEDFMAWFYPDHIYQIDFAKGYEFLDKELEQLFPESAKTHRYADKLVKVYLTNGQPQWILIHIEVQGYGEKQFEARMFSYYYRLYDRYSLPVETIVIFTDQAKTFRPTAYETKCLKTELIYRFNTFKLLDHTVEQLGQGDNPFGIALQIAREAINRKRDDQSLFDLKTRLVRRLFEKGYDKERIQRLLWFIQHYVSFGKPEFEVKFGQRLTAIQQKKEPMGLKEIIEQAYREEGRKEGRREGRKEGKLELIKSLLETKTLPPEQIAKITKVPLKEVMEIQRSLEDK